MLCFSFELYKIQKLFCFASGYVAHTGDGCQWSWSSYGWLNTSVMQWNLLSKGVSWFHTRTRFLILKLFSASL